MAKTIVGLFDDIHDARAVVEEIVQLGVARDHISLMAHRGDTTTSADPTTNEEAGSDVLTGAGYGAVLGGVGGLLAGLAVLPIPGFGPIIAAGPIVSTLAGMGLGAAAGGMIGALTDLGVPEAHAYYYAEGVRRGGTLVSVRADGTMAPRVVEVMSRHHAVDIERRSEAWRARGWTGYDPNAPMFTSEEVDKERDFHREVNRDGGQVKVPVMQEQAILGKRSVEDGGVQVQTRVVETPVSGQVDLREERVNVERHPADRPANAADMSAFQEGTMEFQESHEEAVVSKDARVVEEVVIHKDVRQRPQTVHDTTRRTEVEVKTKADPKPGRPTPQPPPRSTR